MFYGVRQKCIVLLLFCTKSFMLRYPFRAPTSSLCPSTPRSSTLPRSDTPIDMSMHTQKPPTP